MVNFLHTDPGTAEHQWIESGITELETVDLGLSVEAGGHLVVAAAHPDDETLGAGGLIHCALRRGATVHVILCSAGEASHPDSPTHSSAELGKIRLAEFSAALSALAQGSNAPQPSWQWLGIPDGELHLYRSEIECALSRACADATALAAPFRDDGHTDHDVLGELAAKHALARNIDLFEYPVWYWHWATPLTDSRWKRWHALSLDESAVIAKAAAMSCHVSQTTRLSAAPGDEVLLQDRFLEHFQRGMEVFAWTPNTAGSAQNATERFDALYRRTADPWNSLGSSYEAAKRTATLAALSREHYERGLEIGCSIGTLTRFLAARCSTLAAVDASSVAVSLARELLADLPNVEVIHAVLPANWDYPPADLDLVVLSEIGYFLTATELADLLAKSVASLKPGGELLLCHWQHPVKGWPLDGGQVHALAREILGWSPAFSQRAADYLLEVFVTPEGGRA